MENTDTFNVISSGQIKPGYDIQQVCENFAGLLKISVDKARAIIGTKRTLKKDLDESKAKLYQRKLEGIGLVILLKANTPNSFSAMTLTLQPTEEELQANSTALMNCPKCGEQQTNSDQCSNCGVYMHKVIPQEELDWIRST